MKKIRRITPILSALLAFAAVAWAQDVRTDYDKHASFGNYHTYSWEKVQTSDPLWETRIKDAVDKDLQSKGWQKVDSGADIALMPSGRFAHALDYVLAQATEADFTTVATHEIQLRYETTGFVTGHLILLRRV